MTGETWSTSFECASAERLRANGIMLPGDVASAWNLGNVCCFVRKTHGHRHRHTHTHTHQEKQGFSQWAQSEVILTGVWRKSCWKGFRISSLGLIERRFQPTWMLLSDISVRCCDIAVRKQRKVMEPKCDSSLTSWQFKSCQFLSKQAKPAKFWVCITSGSKEFEPPNPTDQETKRMNRGIQRRKT